MAKVLLGFLSVALNKLGVRLEDEAVRKEGHFPPSSSEPLTPPSTEGTKRKLQVRNLLPGNAWDKQVRSTCERGQVTS